MNKELAEEEKLSAIDMFSEMEEPSEDPEVVFQPVMCQHCNQVGHGKHPINNQGKIIYVTVIIGQ